MSDLIRQLVRSKILKLESYKVQDSDCKAKLDAMENPYGLPEALTAEWLEKVKSARLNLYPASKPYELVTALKNYMQVPDGLELLLGNGSDELIQIILLALAKPGAKVLSVAPTFVMYEMIAKYVGVEYIKVDLRDDFRLDVRALLAKIAKEQPAVIFIANPNNPTGNLFERSIIEQVLDNAPGLVVLDEAYYSFTDESFIPDLLKYKAKLLVMRTVSKLGLAGLRLGLLIGIPSWISELDKVRLPYNINVLTQISASFLLEKGEVFREQSEKIRINREKLFKALNNLNGIKPYPSQANFILLKTPANTASEIHKELGQRGVLVKNPGSGEKLKDCLRVSIGTRAENEIFLNELKSVLDAI